MTAAGAGGARVLLVYPLPHPAGEALLADAGCEMVRPADAAPETLAAQLADVDAVILRGPAQLDERLIATALRLRVIGATGSGTDNIAVAAATRRGIPVVHGAGVAPRPVAEYVLGAMVAAHRGFLDLHAAVLGGAVDWVRRLATHRGVELTGTILGVVGVGFIGQEVARRARAAFDVTVLGYDPAPGARAAAAAAGVEMLDDLDELLERSLTVSVHVPLLATTRGLIDAARLRRIGPQGVLVDAARGGVVDEEALLAALRAGELKAAVLDVYDGEPPAPERLARFAATPHLLLTPHVAGVTDQSLAAVSRGVAEGVLAVLEGRRPPRLVNPDALALVTAATAPRAGG